MENPSDREVFFFLCAGDVMAACTCGSGPAGGSESLPDGSVHVGRSTRQLHDVTGRSSMCGCACRAKVRELRVSALEMRMLNLIIN